MKNIQEKYPNDFLAAAKAARLHIEGAFYNYAIEATEKLPPNRQYKRGCKPTKCIGILPDERLSDRNTEIRTVTKPRGQYIYHLLLFRSQLLRSRKCFDEAHDILEVARQYDKRNVNLLYYLGRSCSKTSWKDQGVAYLEEAVAYATPPDSAMVRLYVGLTDCYKMALMPKEQIKTMQDRYDKYDIENHKLLYDMAYVLPISVER